MDEIKGTFFDPITEFVRIICKKWPQISLIFFGVVLSTLKFPWKDISINIQYIYGAIPIIIGVVWLIWDLYRYRFLRFTQGDYFGIIWNWHWKRDRHGEGTWTVSPVNPQCPDDLTRLTSEVKTGGKQYWSCVLCNKKYGGKMTLEECGAFWGRFCHKHEFSDKVILSTFGTTIPEITKRGRIGNAPQMKPRRSPFGAGLAVR